MRNKMILALAAAGTMLVAATSAMARDGCGRGFHRGWHDRCVPNRGPGYYAGGPNVRLVIGNYYPNRGYWDGRRYWQHRERWRGNWRYR